MSFVIQVQVFSVKPSNFFVSLIRTDEFFEKIKIVRLQCFAIRYLLSSDHHYIIDEYCEQQKPHSTSSIH